MRETISYICAFCGVKIYNEDEAVCVDDEQEIYVCLSCAVHEYGMMLNLEEAKDEQRASMARIHD